MEELDEERRLVYCCQTFEGSKHFICHPTRSHYSKDENLSDIIVGTGGKLSDIIPYAGGKISDILTGTRVNRVLSV